MAGKIMTCLMALFLLSVVSGPVGAGEEEGRLQLARWSAAAFGHSAGGLLCWIEGADGSLRLELLTLPVGPVPDGACPGGGTGDVDLQPVLVQDGEGWTLILGPDGQGTLNEWDREWRHAPAGLGQLVLAALAELQTGASGRTASRPLSNTYRPRFRGAREGRGGNSPTRVVEISGLGDGVVAPAARRTLRGLLVERGRGLGGAGEIVTMVRAAGDTGVSCLRIRSSRRPGALLVGAPAARPVAAVPGEVFLPLWPLSDLLEFTGTHSPPDG
jgi:hypothetical protein